MAKQLAQTQESLSIISGWSLLPNPNIHDPVFLLTDEADLFLHVLYLRLELEMSMEYPLPHACVFLFNS